MLTHDLRLLRKRATYSAAFLDLHETTLKQLATAIEQPLRYAGVGKLSVFAKPERLEDLGLVTAVPGARSSDLCFVVTVELWQSFQELSLWIEALCVHEWSLFTEGVVQSSGVRIGRGEVYNLLTERPDNRRPLTWERNQIDLLLLEGHTFHCP